MRPDHPLEQIAKGCIDVEDLVRGVVGKVEIEGSEAVQAAFKSFLVAGWTRDSKNEGFTRLEHVALKKGKARAQITVGNFMGWFAEIEVGRIGQA